MPNLKNRIATFGVPGDAGPAIGRLHAAVHINPHEPVAGGSPFGVHEHVGPISSHLIHVDEFIATRSPHQGAVQAVRLDIPSVLHVRLADDAELPRHENRIVVKLPEQDFRLPYDGVVFRQVD